MTVLRTNREQAGKGGGERFTVRGTLAKRRKAAMLSGGAKAGAPVTAGTYRQNSFYLANEVCLIE